MGIILDDKLILPNTYCYLKDTVCKFDNCNNKGLCDVCGYGLLRAYAARDSVSIGKLMNRVASLEEANKELREELRNERETNKELTSQLLSYKTENSTLTKGLAECCDRLWYYFGSIGDNWSDYRCENVYDIAQFYLERAKKGEDDAGQY